LDLDSITEAGDDGFDFGLDSNYDQVEYLDSGAGAGDATASNPDPKLGYEHEDAQTEAASNEELQTTEVTQNAAGDADGEEYHDEIGYEDDDDDHIITTDVNADLESTKAPETDAGLSSALSEGHPEPAQVIDESRAEESTHEEDATMHQNLDSEKHGETINPQDDFEDPNADEEDTANIMGDDDLTVDDFNDETLQEQYATDHVEEPHSDLSDLDQEIEDLAHSLAGIHDIEVLYKEECYSLIGTPDDDPNSYFLSDTNELDHPLSQFLSTLRAVISNEMSPTDELVVRFDPLDLEFGERSNDKFLSRSFREILDCHAALAAREAGISPDPVIHLVVKRDSEEHFLELLADADLDDGQSHRAEDSETSENNDEETGINALDVDEVQDGPPEDGHLDEYYANGEDTANPTTHEHATANLDEGKNGSELETAPDHDDMADEQQYNSPADTRSPHSPNPPAEDFHVDESLEGDSAKAPPHEQLEDEVNEEQDWAELAAQDGTTASPHAERPLETSGDQSHGGTVHEDDNESAETAEFNATDLIPAPENGETEQGTGSNGKYLSFLSPPHHTMPATVPLLQDDDGEDDLIDYSDDEEPSLSVSASGAGQEPSQQPARQAPSSAPTPEEDELSEIDYSDDEFERYSSSTPPSLQPISGDSFGELADGGLIRPTPPCPAYFRANPAQFLCSSRISESSDTSMAFSFSTDANIHSLQDDDLNFNFDVDADLSTIREEVDEYEEDTITYDGAEGVADVADGIQQPHAFEDTGGSTSKNSRNGTPVAAAADTASIHTSTTINGDEIDYDEHDDADESFTPTGDSAEQSAAASGGEDDEIDWENGEEDEEQQASSADEDGEHEEPEEVTLTPPSIAGKRSRTDETESLAEETGMWTCPSSKRVRLR
jgi:hypothetical protein